MSKKFRLSACAAAMLLAASPMIGIVSLPIAAQAQTATPDNSAPAATAPATAPAAAPTDNSATPGAAAVAPVAGQPPAPGATAAAPGTGTPAAPGMGTPTAPGATPAPGTGTPPAAAASTATPAAPASNITGPAATTEAANPYGLDALWNNGDAIARGVLVILGIMSFGTWYIMIVKIYEQSRVMSASKAASTTFWTAGGTVGENLMKLKANSPFRFIAAKGLVATERHEGTLVDQIDLNTWVAMSIQRAVDTVQNRLRGGLAFLATVGSTAPFVGLFGTVWGIYHALVAIGIAGQASIDKVAGPVGEALIMTAMGLAVAVPAVLGYNWLVQRNKAAMELVRNFTSDIHAVLLSGSVSHAAEDAAGVFGKS